MTEPKKKGPFRLRNILIGGLLLVWAIGMLQMKKQSGPSSSTATNSSAPVELSPEWKYSSNSSEMDGGTTYYAELNSDDKFKGVISDQIVPTTLLLQRSGKRILVALKNKNLQFTCSSFTETSVMVKFDEERAHRYECSDEKSHPYGVLIIKNPKTFL